MLAPSGTISLEPGLSDYNLNRVHGLPGQQPASVGLIRLQRLLGAASLAELVLYASLPTLTILGALVSLAVPKMLGPAQFGQYSLVEALCRYGVAFDLGLSLLADRRLPVLRATAGEAELSGFSNITLWLRLYVAAAALSLGMALLSILSIIDALPFSWLLGMTALTAGVLGMLAGGPTSIERALSNRQRFAILYAGGLAVLSFGRLLGIMAGGIIGCFVVIGVCYGFLALYSHWGMLRARPRSVGNLAGTSFRESVPLFLTVYTYTLLVTANRWVVASQTDAENFGHFAFASSVTTLLVGVVGGMAQLWYPRLARHHANGENVFVSRRVLRDLAALAVASSLVSVVLSVASPWLIGLLYPKFVSSLDVIRIILASLPAATTTAWLLPLALATGARPWLDGVLLYSTALLLLVGATEVGFHLDGIQGAAWGLIVSMSTLVGFQQWRLYRRRVMMLRDAAQLFAVVLLATAAPALIALTVRGAG